MATPGVPDPYVVEEEKTRHSKETLAVNVLAVTSVILHFLYEDID